MTGLIPRRHGVRDNGQVLAPGLPTLARRLRERGYATAAFVSGYPLRKTFGLDAGFDTYDDRMSSGAEGWVERIAGDTTAAALGWASRAKSPWFLWIHYYDPHDPYTPPAKFLRPGPRGAYDGEVAYVDSAISELLRRLPAAGRPRITVITGDHGESLGEHGENGHGFFLYDTTVLVPMIFHAPGRFAAREEKAPARLIDIAPTLLEMAGAPALPGTDGRSLVPLLGGKPAAPAPAYLETQEPWTAYGWAPLSGIRDARWKLVQAPRPELYDVAADPGEQSNVLASNRPATVALLKELRAVEARHAASSRSSQDAEAVARLRSLGYLGAGSSVRQPGRNLADPKDRINERAKLLEGEALLRRGAFDQAVGAFRAVLDREPENPFALLRTGVALLKKGDLRGAIPFLERAVRIDPERAEGRFALADALTRSGQTEKAVPQWMEMARLEPRRAAAWSNLGTALSRTGKLPEAIQAFLEASRLEPDNPVFLANLAFAERAAHRDGEALAHLQKAASLAPPEKFPYPASLGLLLLRAGNAEQAASWLRRSGPREPDFGEARLELARLDLKAGDAEAARRDLAIALAAQPALRARAAADSALRPLLP